MSQLPGDGLCGVSQPFLQHVLGTAAPIVAIALALITKEVYSSLFIGIVVGGLLYANFGFEGTIPATYSWMGLWPRYLIHTIWGF